MFRFDAFGCFVEIVFVELEADEVAFLFDASHGGGAGADGVVEDGVAWVGVGQNEITDEVKRLLRRMKSLTLCEVTIETQDVCRVSLTSVLGSDVLLFAVTFAAEWSVCDVCGSSLHLRIIRRSIPIKHADVLDDTQRLYFAKKLIHALLFLPYPIVSVVFEVAHPKRRAEWLGAKQYDSSIFFADTIVLLPQLVEWDYRVPCAGGRPIRQIAYHGIHASVGYSFHPFEAVHVVDVVNFNHWSE